MNWVSVNHYATLVHEERLARAQAPGQVWGPQRPRRWVLTLQEKLAVRRRARPRTALAQEGQRGFALPLHLPFREA